MTVILLIAFGCESSSAPPVPPSPQTDSNNGTSKKAGIKKEEANGKKKIKAPSAEDEKEDEDENEDDKDEDKEDTEAGKTSIGKPNLAPVPPSIGGANVGDEAMRRTVTLCNSEGFYFDRYAENQGTCSKTKLAQVKCSEAGLSTLLTSNQKSQFNKSIATNYLNWTLDQCIDCTVEVDNEHCSNQSGASKDGTKVFFVQIDEVTKAIKGKSMFLPVRPTSVATPKKPGT